MVGLAVQADHVQRYVLDDSTRPANDFDLSGIMTEFVKLSAKYNSLDQTIYMILEKTSWGRAVPSSDQLKLATH